MVRITEGRIRIIQNFLLENCIYGNDVLNIKSDIGKFGNHEESVGMLFNIHFSKWIRRYNTINQQGKERIGVIVFTNILIYIFNLNENDNSEIYVKDNARYICSMCSKKT